MKKRRQRMLPRGDINVTPFIAEMKPRNLHASSRSADRNPFDFED